MYATSGSGRVMNSPSRGTMRSWPVRPGKYARANISRQRSRVAGAAESDAGRRIRAECSSEDCSTRSPKVVQATANCVKASKTALQAMSFREFIAGPRFVVASGHPGPWVRCLAGEELPSKVRVGRQTTDAEREDGNFHPSWRHS